MASPREMEQVSSITAPSQQSNVATPEVQSRQSQEVSVLRGKKRALDHDDATPVDGGGTIIVNLTEDIANLTDDSSGDTDYADDNTDDIGEETGDYIHDADHISDDTDGIVNVRRRRNKNTSKTPATDLIPSSTRSRSVSVPAGAAIAE